jgi:hypothetical protein
MPSFSVLDYTLEGNVQCRPSTAGSTLVMYMLLLLVLCLENRRSEANGNTVFKLRGNATSPESTPGRSCVGGVCCSSNSDVAVSDS